MIASYKHSSLLGLVVSDEGEKFYNIGTWSQSYKIHFLRHWRKRQKARAFATSAPFQPSLIFMNKGDTYKEAK